MYVSSEIPKPTEPEWMRGRDKSNVGSPDPGRGGGGGGRCFVYTLANIVTRNSYQSPRVNKTHVVFNDCKTHMLEKQNLRPLGFK